MKRALLLSLILFLLSFRSVSALEFSIAGEIPIDDSVSAIAEDPESGILAAVSTARKALLLINVDTGQVIEKKALDIAPVDVVFDMKRNRVVVLSKDGFISFVGLSGANEINKVAVSKDANSIAVNEELDIALVTTDDGVTKIALDTGVVISNVPLPAKASRIKIIGEKALISGISAEKAGVIFCMNIKNDAIEKQLTINYEVTGIDGNEKQGLAVIAGLGGEISVYDLNFNLLHTFNICDAASKCMLQGLSFNSLMHSIISIDGLNKKIITTDVDGKSIQGLAVEHINLGHVLTDATRNIAMVSIEKGIQLIKFENPTPQIHSIIPNQAKSGDLGIVLSLEGKNFIRSSATQFDSNAVETFFKDNQNLQAVIPTDMLANAGDVPVTVLNPQPGGGASEPSLFRILNPLLVVDSISPETAIAGSPFKLTVTGRNFLRSSQVSLNGEKIATRFLSSSLLEAEAPSIAKKGLYPVMIVNPSDAGSTSNVLLINITDEDALSSKSKTATSDLMTAQEITALAEEDWKARRWADAVAKHKQITDRFSDLPETALSHLRLGEYSEESDFEGTINSFKKAKKRAPKSRISHKAAMKLSKLHFLAGDYTDSVNQLKEILGESKDWDIIKEATSLLKTINRTVRPQRSDLNIAALSCGSKALSDVGRIKGKMIKNTSTDNGLILSLKDLQKASRENGLEATGIKFSFEEAKDLATVPWIAHFNSNHFVTVTAINADNVSIIDPDRGEITLTNREFNNKWSGNALIFPDKKQYDYPLQKLSLNQMESIKGGHHLHGNSAGGPEDNGPVEFDDGPCVGGSSSPGMPSMMVNLANYNFVVQDTDVILRGRGPGVFVKRVFNADDPDEGIFGRSWSSNYETKLTENPGGDVDVKRGSGKMDNFVPAGNGTYIAPRWVYDTLLKNQDGTYSLTVKKTKQTQHFDSSGRLVSITDKNGNSVTHQYDANSRLISVASAAGRTITFSYGSNGKVSTITDPLNRQAFFYYDAGNNLIRSVDMAGNEVEYTYSTYSYMTSIKTAKGTTTIGNVYYDETFGYVLSSITDPLGNKKEYWSTDRDYIKDANGNIWSYLDLIPYGETIEIRDPLGNTWTRGIDSAGNINRFTDPNGNSTTLTYDARGNVTTSVDPLGNTHQFTYDGNDNVTQLENPANNTSSLEYDSNGNLKKVTDAQSGITTFSYNAYGELIELKDANENIFTFAYDGYGNVTSAQSPLGKTDLYTYDNAGRVTTHTDSMGKTTSFTYDGIDRVTVVRYHDGSEKTFAYDCCGYSTVTDPNGTLTYVKNAVSWTTSFTDAYRKTVLYGYDKVGNRTTLTYPDNKTVQYQYDSANRLIKVTDWLARYTSYNYDAAGRLVNTTYPNGVSTAYTYDNANHLQSLLTTKSTGEVISLQTFTVDPLGNRTAVAAHQPLAATQNFANMMYAYDADNKMTAMGQTTFAYDDNGNLISRTSGSDVIMYQWNMNNMLSGITNGLNSYSYKYDGLGRRISRIENGIEKRYVVSNGSVLVETDAKKRTTITAYYLYGLGPIAKIAPSGDAYYYHFDALGSTTAMTDYNQNTVNKYSYAPFGQITGIEETVPNPFKYVGAYGVMDEGDGLYYMRARYYDPGLSRFISKDPIGLLGGINVYAYVGNNPINWLDPWGLDYLRLQNEPYVFGRTGSWIEPGDSTGSYLEDHVTHAHETAVIHDQCVDTLHDVGVADIFANYPTMIPSFLAAAIYNNLTDYSQPQQNYFILFQLNW